MAKVSIVIPIYNVEKYLSVTVESVMNQTEKDIEIILVDDGSTDSSSTMCDEYAEKDSRIKVIHKKNGGLSDARNKGVEVATSEYVQLLDGDDYLREDAVERLLKIAEKYPSDIIQFHYQEIGENEMPTLSSTTKITYQAQTPEELFENLYKLGGEGASSCTKLFRRELLEQIPFISMQHEDEMWCTTAFSQPMTVTYIPDVLYYYVMRNGSIINSKFNKRKLDIFKAIYARIDVLNKVNISQFLKHEYSKLFLAILRLYCEACGSKDKQALGVIKNEFIKNRENIVSKANMKGKFATLVRLMCVNYNFIKIYHWYWKKK